METQPWKKTALALRSQCSEADVTPIKQSSTLQVSSRLPASDRAGAGSDLRRGRRINSTSLSFFFNCADIHLFITSWGEKKGAFGRKNTHMALVRQLGGIASGRGFCSVSRSDVWVEECAGVYLCCSVCQLLQDDGQSQWNETLCHETQRRDEHA